MKSFIILLLASVTLLEQVTPLPVNQNRQLNPDIFEIFIVSLFFYLKKLLYNTKLN